MSERRRVAAVIVRDDRVLMVRERNRGPEGRHDGVEFWTLPGGGVEPGESDEDAVRREVREEVGLHVRTLRPVFGFAYPSGPSVAYQVEVDAGDPKLGVDPGLDCDCPRMVGLDWVPLPPLHGDTGDRAVPMLVVALPPVPGP
jgi:8-oxo-dGTP diphosphatase